MDARLEINMDNSAFAENPGAELARILAVLAERLNRTGDIKGFHHLMDFNGNNVGQLYINTD